MGRRPVTPRSPGRSLGAIGRTTLADSTVGGGHDDLIRRTLQQGGQEWAGRKAGRVRAWRSDPVPVTGAGTFQILDPASQPPFLVDEKWDVDQPCLVSVTGFFSGSYSPVSATVPPDPVTYVRPPMMDMQLIDGDDDRATTGADLEYAWTVWPVADVYATAAFGHTTETLTWTFTRGRPRLYLSCTVDSDAAPGLIGTPNLIAIARVTRL